MKRASLMFFFVILLLATPQDGVCRTLRFGSSGSVPLSTTKTSTPALAVNVANQTWYGHLVSGTASGRLTVQTTAGTFSLVPTCQAQQYLDNGTCTACPANSTTSANNTATSCTCNTSPSFSNGTLVLTTANQTVTAGGTCLYRLTCNNGNFHASHGATNVSGTLPTSCSGCTNTSDNATSRTWNSASTTTTGCTKTLVCPSGRFVSGTQATATVTCAACTCTTSQSCTATCSVTNGTCTCTANSGTQTRANTCTTAANTGCPSWGACTGCTQNITCNSGFTLSGGACISGTGCVSFGNGNGAGTTSTIAADYAAGIYTWNGQQHGLPNSWHGRTITDDLTTTGNFGSTAHDAGNTARCIYPTFWIQSALSTTSGTRPNPGNPAIINSGTPTNAHCWCRVKRRSDNRNGPWIYHYNITANAPGRCPSRCAFITYDGQIPGFAPALVTGF